MVSEKNLRLRNMYTMKLIAECDTWNVAKIIRHQEQNEKVDLVVVFEKNPITGKYIFKTII